LPAFDKNVALNHVSRTEKKKTEVKNALPLVEDGAIIIIIIVIIAASLYISANPNIFC
jgi:hypothetical protein